MIPVRSLSLARPTPALPGTFRSLRIHNYRLYWLGLLVSLVGTWMQSVAQAWLVLDLTGSPLALGTVTALQFLPVLFLSLPAGVIVDRVPKQRLILVTQSVQMLQALALGLLVVTGQVQLWHVYALAMLLGLTNAFDNPARQAFVSELVGPDDLPNAVGLNSTLFNGARILGPALGGVLIALVGVGPCFLGNAASFLAVLASLLAMRRSELRPARPPRNGRLLSQVAEGLRFASSTPVVRLPLLLLAVVGTLGYNFTVTLPLLARYALGSDALGFGGLTSAIGLGSLVGALIVASVQRTSIRAILLGAATFALLLLAVAASPWYPLTLGLLMALGLASIAYSTGTNTTLQLNTPPELRGRVMSLFTLLFIGSTPLGGLATGALADALGIRVALGLEALVCLAGVVAVAALARRATEAVAAPAASSRVERRAA
jgi:MFS family permease